MKLRQLFENIYEQNGDEFDGSLKVIGVCFGRFNPPHRGHKAVWQAAAANPIWYVGTNQSTSGPKDPLPYDVKLQAMAAVWPKVAGHVIPEQSLLTLAAKIYEEHGANVHLKVYTDEDWLVKTLSQYNGVEKEHGMYKFQQIDHVRTERLASATNLRAAVRNGDRASFYKDMGIKPSVTINVGDQEYPVFDVVAHYLNKYPEKTKKAVAEGSNGVSVRGWANQVRKDHGTDIKFVNRKEGGGAVDTVRAINSQGETVGVYNRKTGYPTVFEPKQGVEEGVAETMPMQDAVKVLKHYGAEHFKTTSNELHFYKNGRPFSVDLIWNDDSTRSVSLSSLNSAGRRLKGQGVAEGSRIKTPSGMYRDQHTGVAYSKPTGQDGHDSYMTPDYLIQKYKERLAQIAAGPYKRPKEVAQLQSRIAKLEKQGVAEGSLNEFAAGGDFKPPMPPKNKGNDPWGNDDRSKIVQAVRQLLKAGNKVDWKVPGQMGHVVRADDHGVIMKRWNKPYSKINYSLHLSDDQDDQYQILMVKPGHYKVVSTDTSWNLEEYGDTAKGQKMLTKVQKRAVDRVVSKKADTDPKYAKKNQDTANAAWERMSDKDLDEGEVIKFPKKHKSDLDSFDDCPKCGRDLMGGTYMGHRVKVCNPCKQVYLPPNSGIDQKGNKIVDEIAGAFPSPSTREKWAKDAAASNAAEAKRQADLAAKAQTQRLAVNTPDVNRLNQVNYHGANAPKPSNASWDGDSDFLDLDGTKYNKAMRMPISGDVPPDMKLIVTKEGRQVYLWTRNSLKGVVGRYFFPAATPNTIQESQYWADNYFAERAAALEEASGYIPKNKKEAKDPRWSTALTQDVTIGAIGKNLRAFKLAEQIAEMERDLIESSQKKITKRVQQATAGLNTYGDSEHVSGDYTGYRLGLAVAGADGKNPIDMKAKSWIGKKKSTHPYTKEEQDMLKQAYKAVGATYHDMNNGDMKSKELDSTNKTSPVAKPKKNKYGV